MLHAISPVAARRVLLGGLVWALPLLSILVGGCLNVRRIDEPDDAAISTQRYDADRRGGSDQTVGGGGGGTESTVDARPGEGDGSAPVGCEPGSPCLLTDQPCLVGSTLCNGRITACASTGRRRENGTFCMPGSVCLEGACTVCQAGASCPLAGAPCGIGVIECTTGRPLCKAAVKVGATEGGSCTTGDAGSGGNGDIGANGESGAGVVDVSPRPMPHVCGDSRIDPGETCDDGEQNGRDRGDCNPECSGFIVDKHIRVMPFRTTGNLGGITGADAKCAATFGNQYKAFLVDGITRIATLTPFSADGQVDWVLRKWTRYLNASEKLIWTTNDVALIGVKDGKRQDWLAAMDDWPTESQPYVGFAGVWGGLNVEWTVNRELTCRGWTSASPDDRGTGFNAYSTVAGQNPSNNGYTPCDWPNDRVACVEQ